MLYRIYKLEPKARNGLCTGLEKLSDLVTIGPRKCFDFQENISPRKKKKDNRKKKKFRKKFLTNRKNVTCTVRMASEMQEQAHPS